MLWDGCVIFSICESVKKVTIYSDGGCEGNPGPGGWAAILKYGERSKELAGGDPATTNNRMELQAAISALSSLKEPCEVEFYTDSEYVRCGISEWLARWKAKGWKISKKKPVQNEDLWRELDKQSARHRIQWCWVRGHDGNEMNERCDTLAGEQIAKTRREYSPDQLKQKLEDFKNSRRISPNNQALLI